MSTLPSFNLETNSDVDSQTVNQFTTIIIPIGIKRFDKVSFITHRSQHSNIWCNMHFNSDTR